GFAMMANATTLLHLSAAAMVAAIGGGLFEAPKAAAVAAFAGEEDRSRFYAMVNTVGAIGMASGMQVGVVLLRVGFGTAAMASAALFVVAFFLTLAWLPSGAGVEVKPVGASGLIQAMRDRTFLRYTLVLIGFWFVWVQFNISVPLRATDIGGVSILRWVFALNTGMTIALGYIAVRGAARIATPRVILAVGAAISALGYLLLGVIGTPGQLLICIVIIAFGSLLAYPTQQAIAADLADPAAIGSYLGLNALALAIGGGLGNIGGGFLYDLGQAHDLPALPWMIYAAIGLTTAVGLAIVLRPSPSVGPVLKQVAVATATD
ncbi:MAG TPA: MFS transporter, partial [Thermomicrobiales bacterium]|nr:MFS transporter [Thermomicrobiales bacterium]